METKTPGDATPEEEAIREVNTGIYAFAGGDLVDALGRLTSDNAQGELYLPDVLPLLRADGKASAPTWSTDATLTLGVNTRVELAQVRRLAQERIHRATCPRGRDDRRSASTLIDAGVEIGARHDRRARHVPARRDAHRRALRDRPADHADRHRRRRRDPDRALLPARRRARRAASRSARSPTCARRRGCATRRRPARSWRSRTPRSARARRSRTSPTSATPTSAPARTSAPATITANYDGAKQAPHHDRRGREGERPHLLRRPGARRRRRLHRRRIGDHRRRSGRRAGDRAPAPAQRRGLRRARTPQKSGDFCRRDVGKRAYTPACGERAGSPRRSRRPRSSSLRQAADALLGAREPRAGGAHRRPSWASTSAA